MSLPVFIHPDLSAARTGEAFSFSGPEARHAVTVKRMGEGERLELIDGTGIRLTLTITAVSRPASHLARLAGQVGRRVQSRITDRYLSALADDEG